MSSQSATRIAATMPRSAVTTAVTIATSATVGVGAILFAGFWFLVALGGVPLLSGPDSSAFVVVVAGASLLFGTAALAAVAGLWHRTAWAPFLAVIVGGVTVLSSGVAVAYAGAQPPLLVGVLLGMSLLCSAAVEVSSRSRANAARADR